MAKLPSFVIVGFILAALLSGCMSNEEESDELDVVTSEMSEGVTYDSVTLKCSYHYPGYYNDYLIITWRFEPTDGGEQSVIMSKTNQEDPIYYGRQSNRLEHVGSRADLRIDRLELLDDGIYTCEVDFYLAKSYGTGDTRLHVYHFVDFVDLLQYNEGDYVWAPAGSPVSFDCKATRAKPAAELNWYKSGALVTTEEGTYTENSDGTFNTESTFEMVTTLSDHNAVIKCESKQDNRLLLGQRKYDSVVLNTSGAGFKTGSILLTVLAVFICGLI